MAVMAHAPTWAQPKVEGKYGIVYWGQFPETNVTREFLPQWQEWARRFVDRYKDTVRAASRSTSLGMAAAFPAGTETAGTTARSCGDCPWAPDAADPTFTVLANDSSMNVEDNLMPAPGTMDLLDGVSVHTFRSYNAAFIAEFESYGNAFGTPNPGSALGLRKWCTNWSPNWGKAL